MKKLICAFVTIVVLGIASTADARNHHHAGYAWWPGYWPGYVPYSYYGPYSFNWYVGPMAPQTTHKPRLPNDKYYDLRLRSEEARHKYRQKVLEHQRGKPAVDRLAEAGSFVYQGKEYDSYKEFRTSRAFMEMKARAWMNEVTKKAEKSLADKKMQENYARTNELRSMSFSKKQHYRNGKVVERELGKTWWKVYGSE